MSATPNNAAPGWDKARPLPPTPARETREADGHNALQGLLAFACIHQQAARRKRETQAPSDSSLRFSREEELALDEILQLVAVRAIAITGADGVAIALAKDRAIVCRASAGKIAPDPGVKLDPNSGFSGACLRSGEIIRCDDSDNDSRVNPEACRALGARSMIAVPLSAKKRVIGLLEAFSSETHGFNDSDVRSLNLLGELILAAVRPEEEHHLAEMAREVLPEPVSKPAPVAVPVPVIPPPVIVATAPPLQRTAATPAQSAAKPAEADKAIPAAPVIAATASKVLLDEKFAPAATAARISIPEKPREQAPIKKDLAVTPPQVLEPAIPKKMEPAPVPLPVAPSFGPEKKIEVEIYEQTEASAAPVNDARSFLGIMLTAAGILIAIGMAGVLIWKAQHLGQPISADTQVVSQARTADSPLHEATPASPAPPLKIGELAQVMAIHHSSTSDSSTVVVDLQDQVQYEAHSLDDPPRIYFDLHDTKLSPTAATQLNVDDAFLKRVRVAEPMTGITRVVLETKNQPDFSVSLDNDPYRLTIQVHKPGAAPATSAPAVKPQPILPKPSPAVSASPNKPIASSGTMAAPQDFQIVLDAGHGGWDLGTVGKRGLLEKDLALDIVERLGTLLETRLGANVVYTRQDDLYMSLEKRAEIANLAHADLFLSVHANYSDLSTARGVETYYTNTYSSLKARTPEAASLQQVNWSGVVDIRAKVKGAKLLASDIQTALYGGLATRNPDIRNRGVKEAQYVVLTGTQMPAVLAEVSFVSSPADEDRLQSSEYRQQIAESLYKGVVKYRHDTQHTKLASVQKVTQ
ncbi:MAG TPA: N-acetylmuramoyl-L-alanine amidase [Terriglobales bacterium]|nr:N-acetylmuramoyl-L-alanine amidase [Terriglobales bacterium]